MAQYSSVTTALVQPNPYVYSSIQVNTSLPYINGLNIPTVYQTSTVNDVTDITQQTLVNGTVFTLISTRFEFNSTPQQVFITTYPADGSSIVQIVNLGDATHYVVPLTFNVVFPNNGSTNIVLTLANVDFVFVDANGTILRGSDLSKVSAFYIRFFVENNPFIQFVNEPMYQSSMFEFSTVTSFAGSMSYLQTNCVSPPPS